jgi:MFS family permease
VNAENREFYGWKLVGALWCLDLLNLGFPLYGGSIINTYMLKEIVMSRGTFGMAFGLLNLAAGVPSILIAMVIVKWGIRTTFVIGSSLILIGTLWMAFVASQPWHYLLGFGLIIGLGIGFGTIVPLSTALTRWFKLYRGRAIALAMTASGLAGFIGAPALDKVLSANGGNWRQAWMIVAGIATLSGIIALLFVKERPEDHGQLMDGILQASAAEDRAAPSGVLRTQYVWSPAEAYRTASYWLIFIGSIACQFPFFFLTAHWVLHLKGMGISPANAALAMGIFTMGSIVGRLVGGVLMDAIPARFVFMLGICCTIIGAIMATEAIREIIAYPAAVLLGIGFGWTFVALNTVVGNFYGSAAFPKLIGMMFLMSAIACSPAGLVGGKLFDIYQSYTPAFILIIGICVTAIVALAFARIPQAKNAQIPSQ